MLAGLIAELDEPASAWRFYDHVCEALCSLTELERAGVLLYDPATRAVSAVGSHGIDRDLIGTVEGTLEETPIAQAALAEDRIVVVDDVRGQVPDRYAGFGGITTLACGPIAAAGRWLGILLADQGGERFDPSPADRETMMTLGRLAALAAGVERATRQDERARRLAERIELTQDIHERVVQRLFGLTLAVGSGERLTEDQLGVVHDELGEAIADLRAALGRPIGERRPPPARPFAELLERRAERTPALRVASTKQVAVPERLERLACAVLIEALRNCEKHASPSAIDVRVATSAEAFELEIVNDGAAPAAGGSGLGLRMLALEALQDEALVEFGPLPEARWRVRLVGPAGG